MCDLATYHNILVTVSVMSYDDSVGGDLKCELFKVGECELT